MHKRLLPPVSGRDGPASGVAGLDPWLWSKLSLPRAPKILDVGCGLGGTLGTWTPLHEGSGLGVSLSKFQVEQANAMAAECDLSDRLTFRQQSFDSRVDGGPFDCIVAIETLCHTADLHRTLSRLSSQMAPEAVLVLVEDMLCDGMAEHPSTSELKERWCMQALHTADDYRRGLAACGLSIREEIDLTDQVPVASRASLLLRSVGLRILRRLTPAREKRWVFDAFLGGIALEDLYGRGGVDYRMVLAQVEESM